MLLWHKVSALSVGIVVVCGTIAGLTIPLMNQNNSAGQGDKKLLSDGATKEGACLNGADCNLDELCNNTEDYGLTCMVASDISDCSAVECEEPLECIKEDGESPTCTCGSGFVTIGRATDEGSERNCHKKCENSSGCGREQLCYQDEISDLLYCADRSKGCEGAVCPYKTKCMDTKLGYGECKCVKGYTIVTEGTNGDNVTTCEEHPCNTSNNCKVEYLCYYEDLNTDRSGVCSTRLNGSEKVKCPPQQPNPKEAPSGFVECVCDAGQSTEVAATEDGQGTERSCHTSCTTSNDCNGTAQCYKDSITGDLFCDDAPTECIDAIGCPENFHCEVVDSKPQCVCDDEQSTSIIVDGATSTRSCFESCDHTSQCSPETVCYSDDTFVKKGCVASADLTTCSGVSCEGREVCRLVSAAAAQSARRYPQCVCPSNGLLIEITIDGLTESLCRKKCTTTSTCGKGKVCKAFESGTVCFASAELTSCTGVSCEGPDTCVTGSSSHPQCKCPSGQVLVKPNPDGTTARLCLNTCTTTSDCKETEVCNAFKSGRSCIASVKLNACKDVKCDAPFKCAYFERHPKCLCPPNTMFQPDVTADKQCRKSCSEMDDCEPGTLCFSHPILGQFYCEDRDLVPAGSCFNGTVMCSSTTECLTRNGNIDCYCKHNARTLITRTETGSERICGGTECEAEDDCTETRLADVCYTDPYTLDNQCAEPEHVASCDNVHCSESLACIADDFSCGCLNGETTYLGYCHKVCTSNQQCTDEGLGDCDTDASRCVKHFPRDTTYTGI